MALHDFKGSQAVVQDSINPALQALKAQLDKRKPLWAKLTEEQKRKLIKSGKDPVLNVAWTILKYLCDKDLFNIDIRKEKFDG